MTRTIALSALLSVTAGLASAHGVHPPVPDAAAHDLLHWAIAACCAVAALAAASLLLAPRGRERDHED